MMKLYKRSVLKRSSGKTAQILFDRSDSLKRRRTPCYDGNHAPATVIRSRSRKQSHRDGSLVIASVAKQSHSIHISSRFGKINALIVLGLCLSFILSAGSVTAHPAFNVRRGLSALAQGDLEMAETELQRARFAQPDDPVVTYNLGIVNYRRRDYEKAARFFMQSAATAGTNEKMKFDSLYNLGNAAFKGGDYAAAVSAYTGSLEVREDVKARYNLQVAQKKLEELQKQQEQQQKQQQQNQQNGQKQPDENEPKSGDQQNQNGQQNQNDQQNQNGQRNQDNQQQSGQQQNQQAKGEQNQDSQSAGEDQQQTDADQQKQSEEAKQQQADKSASPDQPKNASQSSPLDDQFAKDPSEDRQDVDMGEQKPAQEQKPQASQRARALKNVRLNPYQVERLLKQMQERERQAQLHYRNDPQRMQEDDPFNMDAQQLREWLANRGRRRQKQPTDEPDW